MKVVDRILGEARKVRRPTHEELTDPFFAYTYSAFVVKGRFPEGEAAIAKSIYKDSYLTKFPEAKEDWAMNGWIDWLDT